MANNNDGWVDVWRAHDEIFSSPASEGLNPPIHCNPGPDPAVDHARIGIRDPFTNSLDTGTNSR